MSYIDDRNYWNDNRVLASMQRDAYKVISCDQNYMVLELDESIVEGLWEDYPEDFPEDSFDGNIRVPTKFEACGLCRGSGKTVNPAVDAGGISRERFDEDPEFHEAYMRGDFDVTCAQCGGLRVVPEPEIEHEKIKKAIEGFLRSEAQYAREVVSERMMGA